MRMHGSTGIDLAYTGAGVLGGAISFGHHVWDHAAGVALVRAAGGVVTDLAGETGRPRRARRWPGRRACTRGSWSIVGRGRSTGGVLSMDVASPRHPVPGRRRRPGGQGRQLREPAGRRRSRRAGRGLRRRGRRRADLPRRDGVLVGPGHHARRRPAHRRAGVHPADRRRRRALGRRRRRAAARGRGQGVGQHRRDRAPRTAGRAVAAVRIAVHRAVRRRPHRAGGFRADAVGLGGHHPRRPARHRHRRRRMGPPRSRTRRRRDPAQLDGRRRHQGGLRPGDAARGARRR